MKWKWDQNVISTDAPAAAGAPAAAASAAAPDLPLFLRWFKH